MTGLVLADTSAWVEYDRGTGSPADQRVTELLAGTDLLAVTEPVVMEVLAGARTDRRESDLRRLLGRCRLLRVDPIADFDAAARVHRRCRRVGVAPRGLLDCLVVVVAWRHGAVLLSHDADLDRVARTLELSLDPASLRAER